MERIGVLLDKIKELNNKGTHSIIDIDLMTDYTKVLYADLLEWRSKMAFSNTITPPQVIVESKATPEMPKPAPEPMFQAASISAQPAPTKPATPVYGTHYNPTDIRLKIGINDKYQFISELFGNDKDLYEQLLDQVNKLQTEEEAVRIVHQMASNQFWWNEESDVVQTFYQTVKNHFSKRH
ncbi:MAG: hypothetical protein JST52_07110 [Bacteroidetes bacterium]|nr:hypothetical protein [Bacteroidota bacterium]MBS1776086.1 hypothetical protein [Bacteroidota bacterium]